MGVFVICSPRASTVEPVVSLGEIHTGILQNSFPIASAAARELLALIPHRPVRTWERPVRHAASPEVLVGVDDLLPTASGGRVRCVGTLTTHTRVTGGRVVQGVARGDVVPSPAGRRLQWSYYLARPARLEVLGQASADRLADGFLSWDGGLDPGGACAGVLGAVQGRTALDRQAPLPARRSRFRWAATPLEEGARPVARLRADQDLRTLRLAVPGHLLPLVPELCRDLALHDWLVTTVIEAVDRAGVGLRPRREVVARLGPLVDHVLPLWMPAAHLDDRLLPLLDELDRRAGLTRQWTALVQQIRDQISLVAVPGGAGARDVDLTAGPARWPAGREAG